MAISEEEAKKIVDLANEIAAKAQTLAAKVNEFSKS